MANNYLITGYWGEPHVTAENDRGFNAAVFGAGRFVLPVGEQFRAEYIGNNTVRLYDGKLIDNGAVAGIPAGKYVDLLIPEAGQGMSRNDLIVFSYSKDPSTLVETGSFIVLSGTETSGAAVDPAITQQDLLTDEATVDTMPLYRVAVSGASIAAPAQMFTMAENQVGLRDYARTVASAVNILDNSDWTHPVNQRGETAYRGLGYSIDRWVVPADTAALTVGDGFILIQNDSTTDTAMFTQRLKPGALEVGKVYTGAFCFSGGTISFGSGVLESGGTLLTGSENNAYMQIAPSANYDVFRICLKPGINVRLKWVALYEGEYTAETLPEYRPKGYGAELAECKRYYQILLKKGNYVLPIGYGRTSSTSAGRITIPLQVEMRITPTMKADNIDFLVVSKGESMVLDTVPVVFDMRGGLLIVDVVGTGFTSHYPLLLLFRGEAGTGTKEVIELSADL